MEEQKKVRCAIYTRKSTDEGLDKEFNKQATCGVTGTLSTPDSAIRVELIATDEEMVIARDTRAIVEAL